MTLKYEFGNFTDTYDAPEKGRTGFNGSYLRVWVHNHELIQGFVFGILLAFATGCAGNRRLQHTEALRQEPTWPTIRAAAELEVARKEENTQWSHSAYYAPQQHTNGVWYVVASGAYPLNRLGDIIDILIKDSGEVISYSPRMGDHPR